MIKLNGLHLLLTYKCTYECDHCFVKSSPFAPGTMTFEKVKDSIDQANKLGTVDSIYFEGGEPFLYYPLMLESLRYAKQFGFKLGIVTNGYFATSVDDALLWLQPLCEIGGITLCISDDDFHSGADREDSAAQRTQKAAEQLNLTGIEICIDSPCLTSDPHKPGEIILGGGVRFRGRAAEMLIDDSLPKFPWDNFDKCPDENWDEITRLHLDSYGNLYPCQGIILGNLNNQTLNEVVKGYDHATHPIAAPLHSGGPAELVRRYNLDLKDAYHDACHLCFLARKSLLPRFPDALGPEQNY